MNTFKQIIFLSFISMVLLTACTPPEVKLSSEIHDMENSLYADSAMTPNAEKSKQMIDKYVSFIEKYPSDTNSPVYLFRAADLSAKTNDISSAIHLFGKLRSEYPDHRNAPFALFLQGFIYENQTGDPAKAKPYYEEFLAAYPDHPIAGDVAFSLENLGKTPEELIREFEMRSDTLAVEELSLETGSGN